MRYSILNAVRTRRLFDPTNPEDLLELKHYVDTNQWIDGCPFYLENEWDNIPVMCMHKYSQYMLNQAFAKQKRTAK